MAGHHHEEQPQQNQKLSFTENRNRNIQNPSRLLKTHQNVGGELGKEADRSEKRGGGT